MPWRCRLYFVFRCWRLCSYCRNTLIIWILFGGLFFLYTIWEAQLGIILTLSLGMTILFLYGSEAVRMPMIGGYLLICVQQQRKCLVLLL